MSRSSGQGHGHTRVHTFTGGLSSILKGNLVLSYAILALKILRY